MRRVRDRVAARTRLGTLVVADVSVLCLVRPHSRRLLATGSHPAAALAQLGPDHVIALGAAAGLWLAAAWVALGLLAALGASAPGLLGNFCAAVAAVALPSALRRVVIASIGIGMLAGPVAAAAANPVRGGSATVVTSRSAGSDTPQPGPSWPTTTPPMTPAPASPTPRSPTPRSPTPASPTAKAPTSGSPAPAQQPRGHDDVRVRAGDSLWLIAAHRLGSGASSQRIAGYWPQVYAANRSAIGPDPGLVTPGQLLHLPDPRSS